MRQWRRVWRLIRLSLHIIIGILLTAWVAGILRQSFNTPFYQRLYSWWLGKTGRIIGAQVKVMGQPAAQGTLLVANHISWLDIPMLGAYATPRFLSKHEVRHWPVIGWLAEKSGTLFISRGHAGAAGQASAEILQALQGERSVLLFPEGTTSTGNDVRTFHARLFAAAFDGHIPVQPVALRYPGQDGLTNPLVPYVDEQPLMANLHHLLEEPHLQVEIHFLPVIQPDGLNRKALAVACEQQIRQVVKPAYHCAQNKAA